MDANPDALDVDCFGVNLTSCPSPPVEQTRHFEDAQSQVFQDRIVIITLVIISSIGLIANFCIIVMVVFLPRIQASSNAFVVHQSVIDLVKSVHGLLYAHRALTPSADLGAVSAISCAHLSASYGVLVTSTSFNLLAMVMNEAYRFADEVAGLSLGSGGGVQTPIQRQSWCCVLFGLFTVWFSSLITNLGVTFIPGNLKTVAAALPAAHGGGGPHTDSGLSANCPFPIYRLGRGNYVLHVLWTVLVTVGVALTIRYLRKLDCDIARLAYYRLTTLIRATVNVDLGRAMDSPTRRQQSERRDRLNVRTVQNTTRQRMFLLSTLTGLFIGAWYPLFTLLIVDTRLLSPPIAYRIVALWAWTNAAIAPFPTAVLVYKSRRQGT